MNETEATPIVIPPTNGRGVLYVPGKYDGVFQSDPQQPLAAMVTHVHTDRMVNLVAYDSNGNSHGLTSVPLIQPGDTVPEAGYYCMWMPYQIGQAAKAEQLQAQVSEQEEKVAEETAA